MGARPNFMKAAPVMRALAEYSGVQQILVHTGQHYDANMSDVFFRHLGMPEPDINLEVGSGSHAVQTAHVMMKLEPVLLERKPDWVLVYGDVNSTMAASLVCSKLGIRVAHVEAGLRSADRTMPEEINRLVTDQLADLLFTPSADGDENLLREGISAEKIHRVGNVMIDTLARLLPKAEEKWEGDRFRLEGVEVKKGEYALVTLHRPSNVDDPAMLARLMSVLQEISRKLPVLFPVHPRTRSRLSSLGLLSDLYGSEALSSASLPSASFASSPTTDHRPPTSQSLPSSLCGSAALTPEALSSDSSQASDHRPLTSDICRLQLLQPQGYLDFLVLQRYARLVITDSGGIQEETTYLGVPCLTLRENTERPVTVTMGTNVLVGRDTAKLRLEVAKVLDGKGKKGQIPPLWDGHAAERIAGCLLGTHPRVC